MIILAHISTAAAGTKRKTLSPSSPQAEKRQTRRRGMFLSRETKL